MPVTKKKRIAINKGGKLDREVEIPVSDNPEIQDGVNPKSKLGGTTKEGQATIGLSVGATLNMGDFQSARIDVFIQRVVPDNDDSIKDGLDEISELLHSEIERQSAILMDE